MAIIWLDIETIPSANPPDPESIDPPANYKNPETIAKWQEENAEAVWRKESLESIKGKICSIAWAVGDGEVCFRGIWQKPIEEILCDFELVVQEEAAKSNRVTFGGFNHGSFDMQWLYHRALKFNLVGLIDQIPRERYSKYLLDVRSLWTGGDNYAKGTLYDIAKFLGYEVFDDMDGGKVFDFYQEERFEEIEKYNKHDVFLTRNIAWEMSQGNPPLDFRKSA